MYFVYIIRSQKDNKFYTGITNNLERRLAQHNKGKKSTPSTLHRGPFKIFYYEAFKTRTEARAKEKFLKSGAGREFRNSLLSKNIPR
ncbi:MAG: GIY-YIG nuclease family protein [Candidatus Giovannonibacteria bacterium]|nr:MAG: GIY-YIG nuclease family protein [Candidatus Giovannonibacteria bacterium]